ncbi:serine hydrolase domain-containing protein [Enterococcus pseudoavium]|uniref:serine hydrolase domain-containing protein n=1 Tax=Enterococcus pseudoavium TaxID=44007 RepID=UPI0008378133|nr:serine hydrolase domain-containing protein [Enterococcus pseudoavium]
MPGRHRQKRKKLSLKLGLSLLLILILALGGIYVEQLHKAHLATRTSSETDSQLKNLANLNNQKTIEPRDALAANLEQTLVEKNFSGTALVFKNGQVILNKAYGWKDQSKRIHNTINTEYCIGSVQKGQTAYLIMQAVKAGKLFLDQKLSSFYPQIPNSENISIKDMLNMSSGLRVNEKKVTALNTTDTKKILSETIHQTSTAPNTNYSYQPVNYVLLAGILEAVYQTDYRSLFDKQLKEPMKLKETSFYSETNKKQALSYSQSANGPVYAPTTVSSYADELGTGNVFMSAGDLYRYFQNLFNDEFLTNQERMQLWQTYPGEKYASGIYTMTHSYHTRGVKARFETVVDFSKDGQSGIILLSNVWNQSQGYNALISRLYNKIDASF